MPADLSDLLSAVFGNYGKLNPNYTSKQADPNSVDDAVLNYNPDLVKDRTTINPGELPYKTMPRAVRRVY